MAMIKLAATHPARAHKGNSKYEIRTAPTTLGTNARKLHEEGTLDVPFRSTENVATLTRYAANVAHAQPAIPYLGIRYKSRPMFTNAENVAAMSEIYVAEIALARAA